jgi:predicted MFS family arabinose efflux permease
MAQDKTRSMRALDALNFCNAGIQTGLGPFISIFYTAVRHWNPGRIGILLACQSLSGIAVQSIVGAWVDESHHKRSITAGAAIVVALGALGIITLPSYFWQVVVQLVIGVAVTVFPAVTAAFALGLAEKGKLPSRVARNETLTHTGNVVFALSAAAVGTLVQLQAIFVSAAIFAAGMAPSAFFIRESETDYEAARGGNSEDSGDKKDGSQPDRASVRALFSDKRILTFTAAVVLFYFANAATLPLIAEILTQGKRGRSSVWEVSAMVVVAEVVMVAVAAFTGKIAAKWGRKPLFLIGFGFLAVRNALTVVSHNHFYLIGLQTLDGVAMAIYGVLLTLVTADLAKGTGRFNFLQGAVQSSMGLGGVLSNSLFGFIAKTMGFNASFWGLSAVAVAGGLLYQTRMPETKPENQSDEQKGEATQAASA